MSTWLMVVDGADRRLLLRLAGFRHPALTTVFLLFTRLGDPVPIVLLSLLLLAGSVPGGGASSLGLALAFGASQLLKRRISRPRPDLPVGLSSLVRPPDRFSFPSGHAAASMAVALPPALALSAQPVAALLVLLPALLVGASRAYLGVHYPGDVVAGWTLAAGSVLVALVLLP